MIDLSGIWYRLIACDLFYLLGGIAILWASRFWRPGRVVKKHLYSGIFCATVAVLCIAFHAAALLNPTIATCTGPLLESRRTSRSAPPWPATWQYVFMKENGKIVLELDSFSKKKIFPENGLAESTVYRIRYEAKTDVIVSIESIDSAEK